VRAESDFYPNVTAARSTNRNFARAIFDEPTRCGGMHAQIGEIVLMRAIGKLRFVDGGRSHW